MGQRRMFSQLVVDTDNFIDLPSTAKVLYFYLNMHADDDGFLSNPKTIKRMIGATDDDLKILIAKQYVLAFDDGVVVIKDWHVHNYIRKDRYKETVFQKDKAQLVIDEYGKYQLVSEVQQLQNVSKPRRINTSGPKPIKRTERKRSTVGIPDGIPGGNQYPPQVKLSKDKLSNKYIYSSSSQEKNEPHIPYKQIIDYLNKKVGTHYRATSNATRKLIKARWKEKFTLADFKKVIDNKVFSWQADNEMKKYLRPQTLFGTKFESYLNENDLKKSEQPKDGGYDDLISRNGPDATPVSDDDLPF